MNSEAAKALAGKNKMPRSSTDEQLPGMYPPRKDEASLAEPNGSPTVEELAALKAENAQLKDIVRKCNRDWHRLKDFIIACNGPGEMIRFQDAARKNNNKGVEIFLSYLDSLWRELDKAKSENHDSASPVADPKNNQ